MRGQILIAASLVVTSLPGQLVLANNYYFLPGDAFFHCTMTKAQAEALAEPSAKPRVFKYSLYGAEFDFAFCGYAGYTNARIPKVDDRFAANLAKAYTRVRSTYVREWRETLNKEKNVLFESNPVHVFFYRADYDFKRSNVALRYNENWVAEVKKFGHRRAHARLCCFISGEEPVTISWRDSELIPGFEVTLPEAPIQRGKPVDEPLTIAGAVKAIVLPPISLSKFFAPDNSWDLFVVDSTGIVHLMYDDDEHTWVPFDTP